MFTVAFENDPVALAMLGGDASLLYALERATVECVAIAGGLWVASHNDQDFVSAATWLPPGRVLLDTYAQTAYQELTSILDSIDSGDQQNIFNDFLSSLKPELTRWWTESVSLTLTHTSLEVRDIEHLHTVPSPI